jgi:hypothetical protein
MKNRTEKATIRRAFGKALKPPVEFNYSWTEYENPQEMIAASDDLNPDERMKTRNKERQLRERGKEQSKAFEARGIKADTWETSDMLRLTDMFKLLKSAKLPDGSPKYTDEAARELASTTTGVDWPDTDDEE